MDKLNRWFEQDKEKADFRVIYISEAHPSDGWQVPKNERDRIFVKTHKSLEDRRVAAKRLRDELGIKIPILIDDLEDHVANAYQAWPDRIYIVDKEGKVMFRGRPGPAGFDVGSATRALASAAK